MKFDKFLAFDAISSGLGRALKMAHRLWGDGISVDQLAKEHACSTTDQVLEMLCSVFDISKDASPELSPRVRNGLKRYVSFEARAKLTPLGIQRLMTHTDFDMFQMIDAYYKDE